MSTPLARTLTDAVERAVPAPDGAPLAEPSIWDTLSDEDRASIERGLAQSLAGLYATDEEVEAAFATFGPGRSDTTSRLWPVSPGSANIIAG